MEKSAKSEKLEKAIFAAGCFWCVEAIFSQIDGVESVLSGYTGGEVEYPDYNLVCSGDTGHAEAVEVEFDPEKISYDELLDVFFRTHDPTQLNKQGNDVGTQYRSAIFYLNDEQKNSAKSYIEALEKEHVFDKEIVTQVLHAGKFYKAEDYHQKYFEKNPDKSYCQIVINPKLQEFREKFSSKLKPAVR